MDRTKFSIKKYFLILIFLFTLFIFPLNSKALEEVKLYLFYSKYCPHCANEKVFLEELSQKYSNLKIEMFEVAENEQNSNLLSSVKNALGTENSYVPYTVIGKIGLTGYNENIRNQIEHFVEKYSNEATIDVVSAIQNGEDVSELLKKEEENNNNNNVNQNEADELFTVPVLGKINPKKVSLPLLAVIMGTIDGFNPCAMWVLLFLISMLIGMKDRKKMWLLGLAFLITSAFIYLLFMVSWLSIAISITSISWIQKTIALVALFAGIWNLYQFWKTKDTGCNIVDKEKRKRTLSKIKKIVSEKSFLLALIGVMTLAISVNIVELACSAGLPLVFTQILAINNLYTFDYIVNIFIYIFFFLIDDLIVFFIAMMTMKISGITGKYAKYSHFIGGIMMVLIGILLFFKPAWLMFQFS